MLMTVVTVEVWEMIQTQSTRDINTKYILVFLIVFVATKTSELQRILLNGLIHKN